MKTKKYFSESDKENSFPARRIFFSALIGGAVGTLTYFIRKKIRSQ